MEQQNSRFEPFLEKEYLRDDDSTQSDSSAPEVGPKLEPKKGLTKFFLHLKLLLYKNVLLFWRNK